jgi:DNA-binding transcriptional regulator YiaG
MDGMIESFRQFKAFMLKNQPHIGKFITEVRQQTGLTQEQFAAKLWCSLP